MSRPGNEKKKKKIRKEEKEKKKEKKKKIGLTGKIPSVAKPTRHVLSIGRKFTSPGPLSADGRWRQSVARPPSHNHHNSSHNHHRLVTALAQSTEQLVIVRALRSTATLRLFFVLAHAPAGHSR